MAYTAYTDNEAMSKVDIGKKGSQKSYESDITGKNPMNPAQMAYVQEATTQQNQAESCTKREEAEQYWKDEYLAFVGKQWDLSIAPRSNESKKRHPNAINNFILPTIMNIVDGLTVSMPEAIISGRETSDDVAAEKLNDIISFILYKNKFRQEWKSIVLQGIQHGLFIGAVLWDSHWSGGKGPKRWVGDIRVLHQKKEEIFFDPAILDLEVRLQECGYINRKFRKKLTYFKELFPEMGKFVIPGIDIYADDDMQEEGDNPEQATLIENWHKGTPKFVSKYWKERFLEKADEAYAKNDTYKAKEYEDMAKGILKGVHCGYIAGEILLDYIPYCYEDGLYPFVYKVLYKDQKNPYGFGEERNIIMPQVLYNAADEIELDAMSREGLGGAYYDKGSISKAQLENIINFGSQSAAWFEVNSKDGIRERTGTNTPQSLLLFKENKKKIIDTTSQNTAIMQGESPGANVPYASISELGARADVRNKGKEEILEDFLIDTVQLMISRAGQFYDHDREYLIRGNKSNAIKTLIYNAIKRITEMQNPQEQILAMQQVVSIIQTMNADNEAKFGTFNNSEIKKTWEREDGQMEEYVPEFDLKIKVQDERPTSRRYYEQMAMALFGRAIGVKAFWETINNGKFPPIEEIIKELNEMQQAQMEAAMQAQAAKQAQSQNKQLDSKDMNQANKVIAQEIPQ